MRKNFNPIIAHLSPFYVWQVVQLHRGHTGYRVIGNGFKLQ